VEVKGKIVEILDNGQVKVEITRIPSCGNGCGNCAGCGLGGRDGVKSANGVSVIIAENDGFQNGDEVTLSIGNEKFFVLSFALFILPVLAVIIFYLILRNFITNDGVAAILSFIGGAAVFIGFTIYSRRLKMPKCKRD
jgi:positive regulator of sigma E activity